MSIPKVDWKMFSLKRKIFLVIFVLIGYILAFDLEKYKSNFLNPEEVAFSKFTYYSLEKNEVNLGSFKFYLKRNSKVLREKDFHLPLSSHICLEINFISGKVLQFIIRDLDVKRYELPLTNMFPHHREKLQISDWKLLSGLNIEYEINLNPSPFYLEIIRKFTGEIIFSTKNKDFYFAENYAVFSANLPSKFLFGLGERTTTFKLKSGIYTLYNKDLYGEIEDGKGKGKNRYGSHPMYLMREKSASYHITYLRNSFPMDVILSFAEDEKNHMKRSGKTDSITYKVVGGVFDFSIFLGDENPETAIKAYHKFLGGYTLPPFWSMGFHQCRWGYKNLQMIEEVLEGYRANSLPLDTIWMDIDYMNDYQPFTLDEERYNITEFRQTLNEYKKKFVMIIEPTIGLKNSEFELLQKGKELNLFIKNSQGNFLINRVWPGKCHFVDYFNPQTKNFWHSALKELKKKLPFSGIWLDMNEIAAFEAGQVDEDSYRIPCDDTKQYYYVPGSKPFETSTICPNAVHYNQTEHLQLHNYYPNQQAKLTYEFLQSEFKNEYPFILTRANGPGIGRYAAHWSGDNYGTDGFLKFSIAEVFNFNLFGAPMTGADICGFGLNTPQYLCSRWYQMGSLYPFSRSHSHMDYYRKEPFMMGKMLLETTRKSLYFRYSILKYYYALFMKNKNTGTIFRPIFFEFYNDEYALKNSVIDNYFMIGSQLLVVPNLNESENYDSVGYFPVGEWFDLRTNLKVPKKNPLLGELVSVRTDLFEMPAVFQRGGSIIFRNEIFEYFSDDVNNANNNNNYKETNSRENKNKKKVKKVVENTKDLSNSFSLYVAFDSTKTFKGNSHILVANGFIPALTNYDSKKHVESCIHKNCFIEIVAIYNKIEKSVFIEFKKADFYHVDYESISIDKVYLLGLDTSIVSIEEVSNDNYSIEKTASDCLLLYHIPKEGNLGKILLEQKDVEFKMRLK